MQEDFLHYIWKFQYFDKKDLITTQGEPIAVFQPGIHNEHAGPDFLNGKISINHVVWYGQIEIHINSSDWYTHQHQGNKAYSNVILHVVWNHDKDIQRSDRTIMHTLALKDRIESGLYHQYQRMLQNKSAIPCASQLSHVNSIVKAAMLDKALFQRLTNKNNLVYRFLEDNKGNWEETAYQLLAHNFGFKVNSSSFLALAHYLPHKILRKHADNLLSLEALLLGQAGLLAEKELGQNDYLKTLRKEYSYLVHKYQLKTGRLDESQWKFFRLRPANFPTIRIAQLAQILTRNSSFFALLVNTPTEVLRKQLAVVQSAYWQSHYRFGKLSRAKIPGLGKASIENILINTVVPLLVAYGKAKDEQNYVDRAVAILQHLPAEHNKITHYWDTLGFEVKNAFDSQALIELFNNFCTPKKCLSCNIGVSIIKGARCKRLEI